ncbi:hypothetical protein EXIGLDRAFT_214138 [Exidia glandulosa HHB12029]|uniref:Uncharacterized protein n=1 Tax=Exidia glandulosa HHB12029 TaxID=1314781 RepID=A0A165MS49_EXIGL|nr:hypothetical protein EXIGLDRAFT_214138 [Exidia glandulosa HHB12029]
MIVRQLLVLITRSFLRTMFLHPSPRAALSLHTTACRSCSPSNLHVFTGSSPRCAGCLSGRTRNIRASTPEPRWQLHLPRRSAANGFRSGMRFRSRTQRDAFTRSGGRYEHLHDRIRRDEGELHRSSPSPPPLPLRPRVCSCVRGDYERRLTGTSPFGLWPSWVVLCSCYCRSIPSFFVWSRFPSPFCALRCADLLLAVPVLPPFFSRSCADDAGFVTYCSRLYHCLSLHSFSLDFLCSLKLPSPPAFRHSPRSPLVDDLLLTRSRYSILTALVFLYPVSNTRPSDPLANARTARRR